LVEALKEFEAISGGRNCLKTVMGIADNWVQ